MAAKSKEHDLRVKEKRGTSPSFSPTQQRRKSLSSTTATEKQVPNYLKPTQSSRDPSPSPSNSATKKQPSTTGDKPSHLTRRRSFDKPPSPSRIPKPQNSNTTSQNSLRSSSFSSKTNPLQKSQLEKLTKSTKDVGKNSSLQQSRASNVRKSNPTTITNIKKQNTNSTPKVVRKTSTSSTVDNFSMPKPEEEYKESLPTEAEWINHEMNVQGEIQKLEEDKEHNEDIVNEEELDEGKEQVNLCDSSTVAITVTEDHSAPLLAEREEIDQLENLNPKPETDQTPTKENDTDDDQETGQNTKEEGGEDTLVSEKHELGEESKKTIEEVESVSSKEEVIEGTKEATKCEASPRVEKVSKVIPSTVKMSQGGSQGKKDTTAYNDVIEETASKLREQRKNKVKALVGAFETVISLESDE